MREKRSLQDAGLVKGGGIQTQLIVDTAPDDDADVYTVASDDDDDVDGGRSAGSKVRDYNQISHAERDEVLNTSSNAGVATDNSDPHLGYGQLIPLILMQVDESVLVFLIVMLICGIVYACELIRTA